jgi:hypothetical protein
VTVRKRRLFRPPFWHELKAGTTMFGNDLVDAEVGGLDLFMRLSF